MAKNDILDILLQRAEQRDEDRIKLIQLTSKALGDVTVQVPPLKKILELIDSGQSAEGAYEGMEANAEGNIFL